MIEQLVNSNIETILNLFTWAGVILTIAAGAIVCKVAASHNL